MNLRQLNHIVDNAQLISQIQKSPVWNDDPPFFKFVTELNSASYDGDGLIPDSGSGGVSLDATVALKKAVFEAFERFSQSHFLFKNFIHDSYNHLSQHKRALHPDRFCYITNEQLNEENYANFSYDGNEKFYWTECRDIDNNELTYIPAQLIYCPYKYMEEKTICLPISTGSALGLTKDEAIYRGLCEVVERDAFITNYLLSISPRKIIFKSSTPKIRKYLSIFSKYRLQIDSYLLESDLGIPTVLSVIRDNHVTTSAVSIGLKTELDIEKAIIGSIEEAFQIRTWIRRCLLLQNFRGETYTEKVTLRRALFWSNPKNTHLLDFILKTKKTAVFTSKILSKYKEFSYEKKLLLIKDVLKANKLDAYYKEVTHPHLSDCGVTVMKTLIPSLQPHYIDDEYPYHGGVRLKGLQTKYNSSINLIPHPFL